MNYKTFEEAFLALNLDVLNNPDFVTDSRLGKTHESGSKLFTVTDPSTYKFSNKNINRIDYTYAEDFWKFMISGGTNAKEAFKEYPNVARFIEKPKSNVLPDNFNTFYGPRIKAQMPVLLKELKESPNSRRVVFQILQEKDQVLLDSDESLEYPCTDSITYYIRNNTLYAHTHMRSQNLAVVLQLDIYLQGKLMEYIANILGVELGTYTCTMVSAHIYEKDFGYIRQLCEN